MNAEKQKNDKCLLAVRIPCDLHKKLKFLALDKDKTIQDLIVEIITETIKET